MAVPFSYDIATVKMRDAFSYPIDYTLGTTKLGDIYTVGTDADRVDAAAAEFPWWIGYCCCDSARVGIALPDRVPTPGAPAWTDAQILDCSVIVAAHNHIVWATGGGIDQGWYYGAPPLSRVNIEWDMGSYYVNYPMMLVYGCYFGQGPGNASEDLNIPLTNTHAGTRLSIWHEEWLDIVGGDDGPQKHILQTINYPVAKGGVLYAGVLGATGAGITAVLDNYMEACMVKNVRLNGRRTMAPEAVNGGYDYVTTYEDGGVVAWRLGSVSKMEDIHADDFNNAPFMFCSGVPGNFYNLRGMFSNYAGMWIRGDATIGTYGFECDECPTAFRAEGYPDPTNPTSFLLSPGVTLSAHNTKIETGTSNVLPIAKGTMLFDGVGWCVCTFLGVGYAGYGGVAPELLCRIEPFPANFGSTNSYIHLTGLKVFGYVRSLMHHVNGTSSRKWFMDKGEYTVKFDSTTHGFVYNSANGGSLRVDSGEGVIQKNVTYVNRQQPDTYPPNDGYWDDTGATGLPAYTNPAI